MPTNTRDKRGAVGVHPFLTVLPHPDGSVSAINRRIVAWSYPLGSEPTPPTPTPVPSAAGVSDVRVIYRERECRKREDEFAEFFTITEG